MSTTNIHNLPRRAIGRLRRIVKRAWLDMTMPRLLSAHRLSEKAFLARFDLDGEAVTRAALLAHYGRRVKAGWPGPPNIVRDLRIDVDELKQEELIAWAESILEYRFVLRLHGPRVTPQGKIDWLWNPTAGPEWLWALHRHQWWPILGLAYTRTGDERYAIAFVNQMLDWVESNPPPRRKDESSPSWRLMEIGLRMRVSWIPCFALFYDSPAFTDEAKLTMLRAIYDHARFLLLFKTRNNHLLRESNGLAYVSICFPEFKEAGHWHQVALTRLDEALVDQVNQDGSHFEVSTGYQTMVVDEFQNAHDLLQANGLSLPREDLASWLERMYDVMAYLTRPDGAFPQVNDGSIYWEHTQLAQPGKAFGRDDFVYIGTDGRQGTCPTDTSVGFSDAGLYVMRSDWAEDARYLLFDAGPFGGPHGHEDKLSVEVCAFGQAFIVDPGTYTYDKTDPFRLYFVGSHSHNTVLVDGHSQIRRWQDGSLSPRTALGNYATWISQPDFDYVSASYGGGYSTFSLKRPVDAEIIGDVSHTRRIMFVKPDYWVIVDELQASVPHKFQVLFHTPPEIVPRTGAENRVVLSAGPDMASLQLVPADPQNLSVSFLTGNEAPIQGWYSPGSCHKVPATTVIYERESSASTVLATLLYPCPHSQTDDEVTFKPLAVSKGRGLAFVIATGRGSDYLLFSQDDGLKRFGPYESRAVVAGVRTDGDGDILARFEWAG